MKYIDRVIWASVVVVIGAVALPAAVPALVTLAVVGSVCFVLVRLVIYFTTDRW